MQNSSSPSPILDFGRQHATAERLIRLAVLRLLPNDQIFAPRGKVSPLPRQLPAGPIQALLGSSAAQARKA
jgi:hypothetical protein